MFTGIVESIGTVRSVRRLAERCDLAIAAGLAARDAKVGDSVAVNGACLTVTQVDGEVLTFSAVSETLERTNLGELASGSAVNLERAVRAGQRLDGHVVQGHVDGTGRVQAIDRRGDDVRLAVSCDPGFADLLVDKGSVTIDGVSLTVVNAGAAGFDVALIPHTLTGTTLGRRKVGERVNLEADVLGKYVKKFVERALDRSADR